MSRRRRDSAHPDKDLRPPQADGWSGLGAAIIEARERSRREKAEKDRKEAEQWERDNPKGPF